MKTIGIIGAGAIVELYYINTLKKLGFNDILLFDTNTERLTKIACKFNIKAASIDEINRYCEAIIIATPLDSHFKLCKTFCRSKRTLICEKPFLATLADFDLLTKIAAETDTTIFVAHIRRCFSANELAYHHLQQHDYGKLLTAHIFEGSRMNYQSSSNYLHNNPLGGVLYDTGSHAIDSFLWITQLSTAAIIIDNMIVKTDKEEPSHECSIQFDINKANVYLQLSRIKLLANKMVLTYERAKVEVPLNLKPNIIVSTNNLMQVVSCKDACINYMSEAFKFELYDLLVVKNTEKYGIENFRNTTLVLEKLHNER